MEFKLYYRYGHIPVPHTSGGTPVDRCIHCWHEFLATCDTGIAITYQLQQSTLKFTETLTVTSWLLRLESSRTDLSTAEVLLRLSEIRLSGSHSRVVQNCRDASIVA